MLSTAHGDRATLLRLGLRLEYATIAWNAGEVFVTIGLGAAARSLALVAFGLDSLIEIFASLVVVWHLRGTAEGPAGHHRTRRALRLVAAAFLFLALFLAVTATLALAEGFEAERSPLGIAYLGLVVGVMFVLATWKRHTGAALGDSTLTAEANMTYLDGGLAAGIMVALAVNALLGWWWADPLAGLAVAGLALRESWEHRHEARELVG